MELQVPYSVCPEVPAERILWREEGGDRKNTQTVMRMEGNRDNRSGDVPRPCAYADKYTAKDRGVVVHGIFEREE